MNDFFQPHASGFDSVGNVIPDNLFDRFTARRKYTILSGQGVLKRGTALGKVTASGKWVKSLAASNDGSQVIRGILLYDVDATAADADGIVGRIGACNGGALILGVGHTLASIDDDCLDRGIILETVVG